MAAGYTDGCCTNGACRGTPPTCSCDSTCVVFQDCCADVPPSCQPGTITLCCCHYTLLLFFFHWSAIDVLEFVNVTTHLTVLIGTPSRAMSEFHCSVRASRVTNFEWAFERSSLLSSIQPPRRQISNEVGTLDARYSVLSTDYRSVLTIEGVEFADAGNYTCIASIGNRIDPISATTVHNVYGIEKTP